MSELRRWTLSWSAGAIRVAFQHEGGEKCPELRPGEFGAGVEVVEASAYDALAARVEKAEDAREAAEREWARRAVDEAAARVGELDQDEPPRQTADYEYRLTWEAPGVACRMADQDVVWESLTDDEWAALPWEKFHRVEPGSTRGDIHDQRYKLEMWAEDHYEPVRNVRFERRPLVNPDTEWSESEMAVRSPGGVPGWMPVVAVSPLPARRMRTMSEPRTDLISKGEAAYDALVDERDALAAHVEKAESLLREINEELRSVEQRVDRYDAKVILGVRASIGTALREMKNGQ